MIFFSSFRCRHMLLSEIGCIWREKNSEIEQYKMQKTKNPQKKIDTMKYWTINYEWLRHQKLENVIDHPSAY